MVVKKTACAYFGEGLWVQEIVLIFLVHERAVIEHTERSNKHGSIEGTISARAHAGRVARHHLQEREVPNPHVSVRVDHSKPGCGAATSTYLY